jgi:serine/threonine protein kinase
MTNESKSIYFPAGSILMNRYLILDQIGCGGMGIVYKVEDRELGDIIALKILKPEMARNETNLNRFKSEIRLSRKIKHPNVCGIYEYLNLDGCFAISMEYVEGRVLSQLILNKEIPENHLLTIVMEIALALKEAHDHGIVHRDLKPANIMINESYRPVIMDFGIAKRFGSDDPTDQFRLAGTPEYMAPEQIQKHKYDHRADLYALGVIMYELYTGHQPFEGNSIAQIAMKHVIAPPAPPTKFKPGLDPEIETVILKCLERDPGERFQRADEILNQLNRIKTFGEALRRQYKKPRILIADDCSEMRSFLVEVLTLYGFDSVTAQDGEEALKIVFESTPDMILMDAIMPGIDGFRAAELLRSHYSTSHIPIFMVTGHDERENRAVARSLGIKEYICKPVNTAELIQKIQLHLAMSLLP